MRCCIHLVTLFPDTSSSGPSNTRPVSRQGLQLVCRQPNLQHPQQGQSNTRVSITAKTSDTRCSATPDPRCSATPDSRFGSSARASDSKFSHSTYSTGMSDGWGTAGTRITGCHSYRNWCSNPPSSTIS